MTKQSHKKRKEKKRKEENENEHASVDEATRVRRATGWAERGYWAAGPPP
jgi:hypothetical protein